MSRKKRQNNAPVNVQPVADKGTNRQSGPSRWWKRAGHLTFVGTSLIFASWAIQNYIHDDLDDEKDRIKSSSSFDASTQGIATQYLLAFQGERRKERPDNEVLFNTSANYVMHACNTIRSLELVGHGEKDEETRVEKQMDRQILRAQTLKHDRDLKGLMSLAEEVMLQFDGLGRAGRDNLMSRYDRICIEEERWRTNFLGLYAIGGVLVAFGYLRNEE